MLRGTPAPVQSANPETVRAPIAGQRQQSLIRARARLVLISGLFCIGGGLLTLRLTDLAVLQAQPTKSGAGQQFAANLPARADIFDRNGVALARSFSAYGIGVRPKLLVANPRQLSEQIALILPEIGVGKIYASLTYHGKYTMISQRVLPGQAKAINDLGEPAIVLERQPDRLYPNIKLASHVLGYTQFGENDRTKASFGSKLTFGKVGLENQLNNRLSDRQLRGEPLVLSIDARVQQAVESELAALVLDQQAEGAAGIVLDVATGEVVAMASLPDFNPNAPGLSSINNLYNRATYGVYELGSTFKALTIAMAIDTGVIRSMAQSYDASHPLHIAGFTIHDDHALNRVENVPEIFIHSSNIGTALIAAELGRDRQRDYLDRLGFFKPVAIELPERAKPIFPALSNWGELATMTIGFGHGLAVSPLHLATAYAALVNGGIMRPATLLKVAPGQKVEGVRVFTPETSKTMRELLRLVVTEGTGRRANALGYRVGGKTGTAEKPANGHYARGANVSTFAAAFPMDAPRYVVVAMIDNPRGSKASFGFKTAGMVIAPTVAKIVERIGPTLGVTPDLTRDIDLTALMSQIADKAVE